MSKHTTAVRPVSESSYLVLVDDIPVYHTSHASAAVEMAERLQHLFDDPRPLDSLFVEEKDGTYAVVGRLVSSPHYVRSADIVIAELNEPDTPHTRLHASVLVENLRHAVQGIRQVGDVIELPFKPVTVIHEEVTEVKLPSAPNPSPEEHLPEVDTILQRLETEFGTVTLYKKRIDRQNVYAGLLAPTKIYDLAPISTTLNWQQTSAEVIKLLKDPIPFLRIQGTIGANTVRTFYYRMDQEFPQLALEVDGKVAEVDLDNNGDKEIVLETGTPPLTITFTWAENRFQEAIINVVLKSAAVTFNRETKEFDAYASIPEAEKAFVTPPEARPDPEKKTYKYENGKLVEVEPSK